jgi:hypothetical protein
MPKGFLDAVVGDTRRQVESKRVEQVMSSGSVEVDLRRALQVCSGIILRTDDTINLLGTRRIRSPSLHASTRPHL